MQRFVTVLQKRAEGQEAAPREENTAPVTVGYTVTQ